MTRALLYRDNDYAMIGVLIEEGEAFHHPLVETAAGVARNFTRDVRALS